MEADGDKNPKLKLMANDFSVKLLLPPLWYPLVLAPPVLLGFIGSTTYTLKPATLKTAGAEFEAEARSSLKWSMNLFDPASPL